MENSLVYILYWAWGYREKLRGWRQWGRGRVVCIVLWVTENEEPLESPSAQRGQGRETVGTGRLKEREIKKSKRVKEGGPAITWDGSNHSWLISFVPCLPLFPSTSLSQTSPSISRPSLREDHNVFSTQPVELMNLIFVTTNSLHKAPHANRNKNKFVLIVLI